MYRFTKLTQSLTKNTFAKKEGASLFVITYGPNVCGGALRAILRLDNKYMYYLR